MEAELTESSEIKSKTDNLAVTEEANVDEAITAESKAINKMEMFLKNEQNTQAYKKTMNIDIANINTSEKRDKVYTTQWMTIYEVTEPKCSTNLIFFHMIFFNI